MSEGTKPSYFDHIIRSLSEKATSKLDVGLNADWAFGLIKSSLKKLEQEIATAIIDIDKRIAVKFVERGSLDLEFRISDDIVIFSLHSDAFTFPEGHPIWKHSSMKGEHGKGYFGMISVYNFLTDSVKFNRVNDQGVLIARLFVDKNRHFFMEGKKQLGLVYNDPGTVLFDEHHAKLICEILVAHCLDFDIVAPSFDQVRVISVQEMIEKSLSSVLSTGKRLGFRLQSDDDIT
ncbi:MAG: hypothetical protein ACK5C5_06155 [Bacteroidota bacterium]|jgi:hypothetical protein